MILDCVDWNRLEEGGNEDTMRDVAHMYDMLYSVYCAKLSADGQEYAVEAALRESVLDDNSDKSTSSKSKKDDSDQDVIWWVVFVVVIIGLLFYYVILCFTVFDKSVTDSELYRQREKERIKQRKQREKERAANNLLRENTPTMHSSFN